MGSSWRSRRAQLIDLNRMRNGENGSSSHQDTRRKKRSIFSSTQRYTHVALVDMQDAYNVAHPRASGYFKSAELRFGCLQRNYLIATNCLCYDRCADTEKETRQVEKRNYVIWLTL